MEFNRISAVLHLAMLIVLWTCNEKGANGQDLQFPTIGVTFGLPVGIESSLEGAPGRLALLTPKGEHAESSRFLIVLEFTPCNRRELREYSEGIAARMMGKISETTIEGGSAIEINSIATLEKRSPSRVKIVEKDGYFFLMVLHSTSKNEGAEEFNEVCSSVHWTKRDLPSDHLNLEKPQEILSKSLRVQLPRILRTYPTSDTGKEVAFGASNYVDRHEEFFLQARIMKDTGEKSLEQIATDFEKTISTSLKLKEGLKWSMKKPEDTMISSNLFAAEIEVPGGQKMIHKMVYSLVRLPSNQFVLMQFGITNATESAIGAYAKCIDKILDSIEVIDKR